MVEKNKSPNPGPPDHWSSSNLSQQAAGIQQTGGIQRTGGVRRTLGIMTKYWDAGRVKTRLAQSLVARPECLSVWANHSTDRNQSESESHSQQIAARLHERFVRQLLGELGFCGDRRELIGAPREALTVFEEIVGSNWAVVDQGDGDLGDRMKRWFLCHVVQAEKDSPNNAIMIGSDCPMLSGKDLDDAWESLNDHDIVLGKAADGGYYLIGMTGGASARSVGSVFDGIAWSTDAVFEQTVSIVKNLGWRLAVLPERRDIDEVEDLAALLGSLTNENGDARHDASEYPSGGLFRDELIRILNS